MVHKRVQIDGVMWCLVHARVSAPVVSPTKPGPSAQNGGRAAFWTPQQVFLTKVGLLKEVRGWPGMLMLRLLPASPVSPNHPRCVCVSVAGFCCVA